MKFKEKLKKYFTESPKESFWFHAFVTLFIFRYVGPMMIMGILYLNLGLAVPEADITGPMEVAAVNIANAYTKVFTILFETGARISANNPILGRVILFLFNNFIYIIWAAMFVLILNLSRYFISWIYKKIRKYIKHKIIIK